MKHFFAFTLFFTALTVHSTPLKDFLRSLDDQTEKLTTLKTEHPPYSPERFKGLSELAISLAYVSECDPRNPKEETTLLEKSINALTQLVHATYEAGGLMRKKVEIGTFYTEDGSERTPYKAEQGDVWIVDPESLATYISTLIKEQDSLEQFFQEHADLDALLHPENAEEKPEVSAGSAERFQELENNLVTYQNRYNQINRSIETLYTAASYAVLPAFSFRENYLFPPFFFFQDALLPKPESTISLEGFHPVYARAEEERQSTGSTGAVVNAADFDEEAVEANLQARTHTLESPAEEDNDDVFSDISEPAKTDPAPLPLFSEETDTILQTLQKELESVFYTLRDWNEEGTDSDEDSDDDENAVAGDDDEWESIPDSDDEEHWEEKKAEKYKRPSLFQQMMAPQNNTTSGNELTRVDTPYPPYLLEQNARSDNVSEGSTDNEELKASPFLKRRATPGDLLHAGDSDDESDDSSTGKTTSTKITELSLSPESPFQPVGGNNSSSSNNTGEAQLGNNYPDYNRPPPALPDDELPDDSANISDAEDEGLEE